MSEQARVLESHFQNLVNVRGGGSSVADTELDYLQVGQRYRIAPRGQYPAMQFLVLLTNGNSLEIKYAYITERWFSRQAAGQGANEMVIRVRDSLQLTIAGYNLARLNEDLLIQRVVDIGAVSTMQAEAAFKSDNSMPIITHIELAYGRMDMENGVWMPGSGLWSTDEQRWVPLRT